jgi:hypothetical protein
VPLALPARRISLKVRNFESAVAASIRIYSFADGAGEPLSADKAYIGSLGLPRTRRSAPNVETLFRSNPLPTDHALAQVKAPFWMSKHQRIFLVELMVETPEDMDPQAILCIPCHVVRAHVRSMVASVNPLDLHWAEWGMQGSRLFVGQPFNGKWICCAHGLRFITSRRVCQSMPDEDDISTKFPFIWASRVWEYSIEDDAAHVMMLNEDNIMVVLEEVRLRAAWCVVYSHRAPARHCSSHDASLSPTKQDCYTHNIVQ